MPPTPQPSPPSSPPPDNPADVTPLLATTLIPAGQSEPLNDPHEIREHYQKTLQAVVDAGACPMEPTTVIDLTGPEPVLVAWAVYTGVGALLALLAYALVAGLPQAQGSGLPPLIAYLNGTKVLQYSSLRVLFATADLSLVKSYLLRQCDKLHAGRA